MGESERGIGSRREREIEEEEEERKRNPPHDGNFRRERERMVRCDEKFRRERERGKEKREEQISPHNENFCRKRERERERERRERKYVPLSHERGWCVMR